MSVTAGTLIASSLRLLGVLASGESLSANEASDALGALNQLLDSWSTQNLLIPNKVREVFPLISGQASYTMGPSGNFSTSRPIGIESAELQVTTATPVLELPLKILTVDQFASIRLKALSSTYPQAIYAEGTFPLETLNLWPVPSQGNNLVLYTSKPLSNLSVLTTQLSLPPGYERALRYALACELAPEYGREASPIVVETAVQSKAEIKRINSKPAYLRVEQALMTRSSQWDWRTGEPT